MNKFGRSDGGGRRKAARSKAPLLGTLSTVASDYRVGLVNLSSTGVQLRAPELPAQGEDVMFHADKVACFGRVAWSHEGECGVAFEAPIPDSDVERLREEALIWTSAGWSPEHAAAAGEWTRGTSR